MFSDLRFKAVPIYYRKSEIIEEKAWSMKHWNLMQMGLNFQKLKVIEHNQIK